MKIYLVTTLLLFWVITAHAENAKKPNQLEAPKTKTNVVLLKKSCRTDMAKYCQEGKIPTHENDYECINDHFSSLEKTCQNFITEASKGRPCSDDVVKLCTGEDRNLKNVYHCLRSKSNDLSPACKMWALDMFKKAKDATIEIETVCKQDFAACSQFEKREFAQCVDGLYQQNKLSEKCLSLYKEMRLKKKAK